MDSCTGPLWEVVLVRDQTGVGMGEVNKVKLKMFALPSCEVQFFHQSNCCKFSMS